MCASAQVCAFLVFGRRTDANGELRAPCTSLKAVRKASLEFALKILLETLVSPVDQDANREDWPRINHKPVHRLMRMHGLAPNAR